MNEFDQYLKARCKEIAQRTASELDIKVHEAIRYEPNITQLEIRLQVLEFLAEHYGYKLTTPRKENV
jgi:hypothetical protein